MTSGGAADCVSPKALQGALILCFLSGCLGGTHESAPIRVTEVTLFGEIDCFRIETPSATYLYGKRGAGFAGIIDPAGHDWISYRPGGKAAGEYRGLPKCGQPTKFFHCGYGYGQYKNDRPFESRVTIQEPDRVQIVSETAEGASSCEWQFRPTYATLTLKRIAAPTFWFLYEGTPGGSLDAEHDSVLRPGGRKTTLDQPWEERIPWACFSSSKSPYSLVLTSHDPSVQDASYVAWPYKPESDGGFHQMTVFGWGRLGWRDPHQHEPQLRTLPARFSLSIVQGADESGIAKRIKELTRPP